MTNVLKICQQSTSLPSTVMCLLCRRPLFFLAPTSPTMHMTCSPGSGQRHYNPSCSPFSWQRWQIPLSHPSKIRFFPVVQYTKSCTRKRFHNQLFDGNGPLRHEGFKYRHYHSHTRFSLQNPLYDSYLQSLLNELRKFESGSSQLSQKLKNETKKLETIGRLQFLQTSSEQIQSIYESQQEIKELEQMMESEEDSEMRSLIEKEAISLKEQLAEAEDELVNVLVGDEPADRNGVVLEVSAGVGGQEAMLFCAEIFNMYLNYGLAKGWDMSAVNQDEVELGGYRKASIEVSGFDVYKYLKHEAGVHRVQRIPKTEKSGRIHTSTVSVSVLPQPREVDIQLDKKDLKIETFRGSGPGGQSVNTTDSAVRITHIPTGSVAECRQERSQIKNKDIAMKRLIFRMYQVQLEKEEAERRATRKTQMGTRSRSEKIRTYNFQQDRVTDHRVKESQSNLMQFMQGGQDLDDMVSKVAQDHRYQTLDTMLDEFELSLKKKI